MNTVIIQPHALYDGGTNVELVQLRIITAFTDWGGVFDQIEVWRSKELQQGPYEELTGEQWLPARIPRSAKGPAATPPAGPSVPIVGATLLLRVDNEEDFQVTFSGVGPITFTDAAAQVTAFGGSRFHAYVTEDADFVVEGARPGTGAQLEVTGGDAAPLLELPIDRPESYGRGSDARLALVVGKEQYDFTDPLGSKSYYYKVRFRNSRTHAVSAFSAPFAAGSPLGVTAANTVVGYLDLVRGDGSPLTNQLVQVYTPVQTKLVEDKLVTGGRQAKVTDINGHVSFTLVRGVSYTVSIAGTDVVREVVAPTDVSKKLFNLLAGGLEDDAFTVQVPDIIFAERRSL